MMMTSKEFIVEFYEEVFNNRKLTNIDRYMRDDYIQHNAKVEDGESRFSQILREIPGAKTTDGDLFCAQRG